MAERLQLDTASPWSSDAQELCAHHLLGGQLLKTLADGQPAAALACASYSSLATRKSRVQLVLLIRHLLLVPRGRGGCWDQAPAGGGIVLSLA